MAEKPREWKHLERRPGSSYQQLCIKGKGIWHGRFIVRS
jgi:hypothetical protein